MGLRIPLSGIVFFALSLAYLAAEVAFNALMLDVAGTINSPPEAIERAKDFGRVVSASGFTLLTLGLFSRTAFILRGWRDWALMSAVFAFCLMPAVVFLAGMSRMPLDGEIFMAFLPLLGMLIAVLSGGAYRVYVLIAVVLMAWPAMYAGQKIFIEHYAVDKTTVRERADARNVLMLRASLEDCTVDLGEQWLCAKGKPEADLRAVRAIITALWMHNPEKVLSDLGSRQDQIVQDMALKGAWFSPRGLYQAYVRQVTAEYKRYEEEAAKKYYVPYKTASDLYLAATDPALLRSQAAEAAVAIEKEIDKGWSDYKQAVKRYQAEVKAFELEAANAAAPVARLADEICEDRDDCPGMPDIYKIIEQGRRKARSAFTKSSGGYTPEIRSRESFALHPATQGKVKSVLEQRLRQKLGDAEFALPSDWSYFPPDFEEEMQDIIRSKAKVAWEENFKGKVEPGLGREEFLNAVAAKDAPKLDDLLMTEQEFIKTHVVPVNRKFIAEALREMRLEEPLYQNGAEMEEKGKNFVRAAYIPAVALVLSLVIVMLTLVRGFAAGLSYLEARGKFFPDALSPGLLRGGVVVAAILLLVAIPYLIPNSHVAASAYEKYLGFAREGNLITAAVLDWAVHMQPLIYGAGSGLRGE